MHDDHCIIHSCVSIDCSNVNLQSLKTLKEKKQYCKLYDSSNNSLLPHI